MSGGGIRREVQDRLKGALRFRRFALEQVHLTLLQQGVGVFRILLQDCRQETFPTQNARRPLACAPPGPLDRLWPALRIPSRPLPVCRFDTEKSRAAACTPCPEVPPLAAASAPPGPGVCRRSGWPPGP